MLTLQRVLYLLVFVLLSCGKSQTLTPLESPTNFTPQTSPNTTPPQNGGPTTGIPPVAEPGQPLPTSIAPYDFGNVLLGITAVHVFAFTNTENSPIALSFSALSGAFSFVPPPLPAIQCFNGGSLDPMQGCSFAIAFAPTAVGIQSSSTNLQFLSNNSTRQVTLQVAGAGVAPAPTADVFLLSGTQEQRTTATATFFTNVSVKWRSTNATSCTLVKAGTQVGDQLGGEIPVPNIIKPQSYTLTCIGPGGQQSASLQVNVPCPPSDAPVMVSISGRAEPIPSCLAGESNCTNLSAGAGSPGNNPVALPITFKPGFALQTGSHSGRVQWGRLTTDFSDCPGGPDYSLGSNGQYEGGPYVTPVLQLVDASGRAMQHSPGVATFPVFKAAKLTDYATPKVIPPGAVQVIGGFVNNDYSRTSGSCALSVQQIPLCALP